MNFEKRMKIRFVSYSITLILGVVLNALSLCGVLKNEIFSIWGTCFIVLGAVRLVQYHRIGKSQELSQKRKIAETDERNIFLWKESRSLAFVFSIYAASIAVIVLYILHKTYEAQLISYTVMAMLIIYWIAYFVTKRKV